MNYKIYQNKLLDTEIYLKVKEAEEMEEADGKMYTIEDFLQAAYSAINTEHTFHLNQNIK